MHTMITISINEQQQKKDNSWLLFKRKQLESKSNIKLFAIDLKCNIINIKVSVCVCVCKIF